MRACRGLAAACALLHLLLVVAQHDGSCLPVEEVLSRVQPLLNELITLAAGSGDQHEGNCVTNHGSLEPMPELVAKQRNLVRLAQEYGGRGVLEVGFNSGLSAALFLSASPTTRVTSIDIGLHTYVAPCAQLLQQRFPGRFQLIVGDSADVLRRLPLEVVAGLFHVDGSHEVAHARQDLDLAHARMLEGGALLMDDTDTPSLSALLDTLMQSHLGEYDELRYESDGLMASSSRFRHRAIVKAPSTRTVAATQLPSVRACQPEGGAGPTASSARPLREGGALAYRCVSADCFARAEAPSALGARIVAQSQSYVERREAWRRGESSGTHTAVSGPGSRVELTLPFREFLLGWLRDRRVRSLVEASSGHWPTGWQAATSWPPLTYVGLDILPSIIDDNNEFVARNGSRGLQSVRFATANMIEEALPLADVLLTKDTLIHWPSWAITRFLRRNVMVCPPRYEHILFVHDDARGHNAELQDFAGFRPLDLGAAPFHLPTERLFEWGPAGAAHPKVVEWLQPSRFCAAERAFVLWTGDNPMSSDRAAALESIYKYLQVPVALVGAHNLHEWVLPDHPLHPAYPHLSVVHRSDYLRVYLLHHYGGGYTDIKHSAYSWQPFFEQLNADPDMWAIGGPEHPTMGTPFGRAHHSELIGNCHYIFKPRSPITSEWLAGCERELDANLEQLKLHPARHVKEQRGGILVDGSTSQYPLAYNQILGEVFGPIVYRHRAHVLREMPLINQWDTYA